MRMYIAIVVGLALIPGAVTAQTPTTAQELSKTTGNAKVMNDMHASDASTWLVSCIVDRAEAMTIRGQCVTAGATPTQLDPGDDFILAGDNFKSYALAPEVDACYYYGDAAARVLLADIKWDIPDYADAAYYYDEATGYYELSDGFWDTASDFRFLAWYQYSYAWSDFDMLLMMLTT